MNLSRLFLPLYFVFALLAAQQAGATHAIGHALEQARQHDQHAPQSEACEKCASYAQLGSALNVGAHSPVLISLGGADLPQFATIAQFFPVPVAAARGPPKTLQETA